MARQDPLRGFRYLVEIDGITSGAFLRVKGLSREVKHEPYREGGVNEYEHQLLTQVSYPVVILERGLALDDLWKWALAAADGDVTRKTVRVRLQDEGNNRAWAWQIENALPVKWSCTDLDAKESQVVMETLELAHHGLRKAS
ncbi:phage tail protein [Variovorax sp. J22R133]|uniref:phage tail protein n=1 Tax=Variovorax brevis TaxID=3053503 RepID=UPI0025785F29|nr:phage tail protein [Variovorax sp. J22R133]MDM0116702.1 phage tail protein [Variovorax sp. J22R133]